MMKTYWRLLSYARPISKYTIPYFFCVLLHAFFNVFTFALVSPLIQILFMGDGMLVPVTEMPEFHFNTKWFTEMLNYTLYNYYGPNYDTMDVLMLVAGVVVGASLLSNLFRYLGQRIMEMMKINTLEKLRDDVFSNVVDLNVGYFTNERKGDVIAKLTSDVQVVQYCVTSTLQAVFKEPLLILFFLGAMFMFSWQLMLFSLVYLPLVALVIGTVVKKLRHKANKSQETYAEMVGTLEETVSGIKMIKAYNAGDYVRNKFSEINGLYSRIFRSMARRQQLSSPMSEFLAISALAVLLVYGGRLIMAGQLNPGDFLAFIAMFSQVTRPIRAFTDSFATINQGIAAGNRVLSLLDVKSSIQEKPDAVTLDNIKQGIEYRDVHFTYETREVIRGINIKIGKGEKIALVGMSGGGKSTLADLLPRFYDVQQGGILVDGVDIRDYTIPSLRGHIGVVSQDTVLFNDSIEGNIRMGKRDATSEEIVAAAKVANAHEFIMETDCGYQTNIGDRGMKLSGGQRQRLSIARAVLKNPDILILDEATSALDTESEKLVQHALDNLLVGRTSIIIAHRLSTIMGADRIYVIEQGQVIEQGTHDELMHKGGVYSKLVQMQNMT